MNWPTSAAPPPASVIEQIHQRVVAIAREKTLIQGRRLRVDTTVVETNI
jgi:IS5 family transposase